MMPASNRSLHRIAKAFIAIAIGLAASNGNCADVTGWNRSPSSATPQPKVMQWYPVNPARKNKENRVEEDPDAEMATTEVANVDYEEVIAPEYGDLLGGQVGCDDIECGNRNDAGRTFWARAEFLHWTLSGLDLPPLVTTSPTGTTPINTGVLGRSDTTILFGNETILDSFRSGGRLTLGTTDLNHAGGFELIVTVFAPGKKDFSDNRDFLARPVFDTASGAEASMLVAHPDFLDGSVSVQTKQRLHSLDILRRQCLTSSQCNRIDLLIGYRYARLDEMLRINQSSIYTAPQGQIITGTTVNLFDEFEAENEFHGGQIGLHGWQSSGRWKLHLLGKVGLGVNNARVNIDGQTINTVPGAGAATFNGGLLAQQTNIGQFEESQFTVIPEVALTLSHRIDECATLWLGYNMLYWKDTARLANTIDRSVSQFPPETPTGTGNPKFQFQTDDFIAHGLSAGATFSF